MDIALLLSFLTFANNMMGVAIRDLPAVRIEAPAEMTQVCPPNRIACYTLNVIHVVDGVPLDREVYQSVVVHEVVHHVQEKAGRYGLVNTDTRYELREEEAHRIQYSFLNR